MDDEIDLRPYLRALGKHWWWVIGLGLVAVVLGFVVSSLQPTLYEASALALITRPRYQLQFDPRITTQQPQDLSVQQALPTLATSNEVLQALVDAYSPPPEARIKAWTLASVSRIVKASSGRDPSLLALSVRTGSPQASAAIANQWLDLTIKKSSALYDGGQDIATLEGQTAQARQVFDKATAELTEFQSRNPIPVLEVRLDAQQHAQSEYLSTQITISNTIRDLQVLRDQLTKQPPDQPSSAADSLTLFLLQIKAFNVGASLPQLQLNNGESLSNLSRQEQLALAENLIATLQNRPADIEAQRAAQEPKMLALQRALQESQSQLNDLESRQKQAQDFYEALARKLDEARIAAQTGSGTVQVASYASAPEIRVSPRPLRNSAMAGMLALMLGVCVAIAAVWWKR